MKPASELKSEDNLVLEVLGQWAGNAAMHGLPNITRTKSSPKKVAWALLLLGGLCILVYQVQDIIKTYYSYPITLEASSIFVLPTPFPAVTVCNLNPAKMNQVELTMSYSTATTANNTNNTTSSSTAGSISTTTQPVSSSSYSPTGTPPPGKRRKRATAQQEPPKPSSDEYSSLFSGDIYTSNETRSLENITNELAVSSSAVYKFMDYYNQLKYSTKIDVGYQIDEFLIECMFATRYCSRKNFTGFLHPTYGNCFTFNANVGSDSAQAVTERPGSHDGLIAIFYIDQDSYLKSVSQSAGIRVVIHEKTKMPFPEETGINVPTGMETSIGMTRKYRQRLAYPYADNCQDNYQEANRMLNIYSTLHNYSLPNVNYSQVACRKTCVQKRVESACNCSSPNLPVSDPTIDPVYSRKLSTCKFEYNNSKISTNAECMINQEIDSYVPCKVACKVDCEEYTYETTISMSTWPSKKYKQDAFKMVSAYNPTVKHLMNNQANDDSKETFMSESFVKIRVYYQDAVTHSVISTEGYTIVNLLSDMGGQVGLWLGLSVLTLFEIIEVFVDISSSCFLQYYRKHKVIDCTRSRNCESEDYKLKEDNLDNAQHQTGIHEKSVGENIV